MADVTRRMLDLLALLQTKRRFTGAELVERLGVSERTVRRDIDRLRAYGYPVAATPGPGGHYGLAAGRAIPPLMFDEDEVVAIMLVLAASASADSGGPGSIGEAMTRAYGKLDQVLPPRLATRAATVRGGVEVEPFRAPTVDISDVMRIATAVHEHREIEFDYRRGDRESHRRVEPHAQVHHLLRWYLVAWDSDRDDWRVFRTDRVTGLFVRTTEFRPRPMPSETALDLVRAGTKRSTREAVVTVEAPVDHVVAALAFESIDVEAVHEGRTRVTLRCESWQWLLFHLSRLECAFTVDEPASWREAVASFAASAAVATTDRGGDGTPGRTAGASRHDPVENVEATCGDAGGR
ncbi:YafY family transcriptional regulator [Pseudoclavibacter chungangensis]|uniref:YafY family transcriptional regulator n=1 Tax=Pseudoclavibacter chungangensis TaxID=587635 RepID=A0A7J5BQN6_9MICO|nr:YafY family protein [Pseudoclavibacter chungangensis]KAB1656301.1 YafY family transcriptional regulator [Pseudoclavibacter chungangensis]NYJ67062.1 putative DNA-binding transcriptional regulator YafY [Pseudoclavibacter chungangensis]